MKFLIENKLSDNISLTPEGYLLCVGSCIATIGMQEYHTNELYDDNVSFVDGICKVSRTEAELFSEATIASYNLKPFTYEHPDEEVNVDNYKEYACGVVQNVRVSGDSLIADLFITDKKTITAIVNKFITGISCGYECNYTKTGEGEAIQTSIRGNHVSLVGSPRNRDCGVKDSVTRENVNLIDLYSKLCSIESKFKNI